MQTIIEITLGDDLLFVVEYPTQIRKKPSLRFSREHILFMSISYFSKKRL